jgi:putative transposase
VLVAIGVAQTGYRGILGVSEGAKEDKASWTQFMRELKERGLKGVQLFVSDKCLGLVENLAEFYPEAKWQRCVVHFYRNVWTAVPSGKVKSVAAMLKAIHAQEDAQAASEKARQVAVKLREMRLARAAEIVEAGIDETLTYYAMPAEHWRCLRTNNPLERLMREIRRRTRVVGAFPDGKGALMLDNCATLTRHWHKTSGTPRPISMKKETRPNVQVSRVPAHVSCVLYACGHILSPTAD